MRTKVKPQPVAPVLYTTIHDLPLKLYIKCLVDQELKALVISGDFSDDDLLNAWFKLQTDYTDVIGDSSLRQYLKVFQRFHFYRVLIEELNEALDIINMINVRALIITPQFQLYEDLVTIRNRFAERINKALVTSFSFTEATNDEDCSRAGAHVKGLELKFEIEGMKLQKLAADNQGSDKPITRDYFSSTLITLTDHSKVKLDDSISTFEFAERVRRYQDYCKQKTV